MDKNSNEKGVIVLKLGKSFSMDSVSNIRGFDSAYIVLETEFGKITVEGEDLKIEDLSKESGNILVSGNVSGVFCSEGNENKKGFFKRMFS